MIIPAVYVHCGVGLVTTALSIPLVLRRVPMNALYGVRLPQSFKSDELWYDINAYGGRLLLTLGILLTVLGYLGRDLAPPMRSPWYAAFTIAPLLTILALLPFIVSYARRRAREGR
ncbi:MAG: SdpI family protein [Gemmatimonadaceae bacterium]